MKDLIKDFIVLDPYDVYLSWDSGASRLSHGFFNDNTIVDMLYFRREGDSILRKTGENCWERIDFELIGHVNAGYFDWGRFLGCVVYGERDDLMKAVHIFGELRGSGDFKQVISACCEMTVL